MIDFERNELDGQVIRRWGVCFETPKGLVSSVEDAVNVCKSLDLLPDLFIKPVAVAYTADSYEVVDR